MRCQTIIIAAFLASACGDEPPSREAGDTTETGQEAVEETSPPNEVEVTPDIAEVDAIEDVCADCPAPVTWAPCPLYYDGRAGPTAECTTIAVPLRWADPAGPELGVFVQRLRGEGPIRGQLWLLNGGPGGSGADFDDWMEAFRELDPTLDLYTVDHRGTGRSARLSCPEQESDTSESGFHLSAAETGPCYDAELAEWGDDLAEFTTTAAAHDVGALIERAAVPGQDAFVYGVSYGTYWAHRYLQVFPDQATAVVLDSIAPPTEDFVAYDRTYNEVGRDFMDLCGADPVCSDKLGADPWQAVGALFADIEAGHCRELVDAWGIDAGALRYLLGILLMSVDARTYLPATVYRMARCEPGDVDAIETMLTLFFGEEAELTYYDTLGSDSLFYNVALSEIWPEDPPPIASILAEQAKLYVSTGLTPEMAVARWGHYPDDAYVGAWAVTDTPLLMLNGDLDPQTPLAVAIETADHFKGAHQWFITVPRAAHAVTISTPVTDPDDIQCGMQLLLDFLADPTTEPDRSCLADIPAEQFVGDPEVNRLVFGTPDLWENGR